MSRVLRYVATGGVMDLTIYISLALASLLAERAGAGPFELGLLAVVWGTSYTLNAVLGGRISDRVSRTALMRAGLGLIVLVCLALSRARGIWPYYVGLPLIALGMGCFWPSLQAAIADESGPSDLTRNLGWFNVSWSIGKGLGVLAGGYLVEWLGRSGFLVAAGIGAILVVVLPRVPRGGGRGGLLVTDDDAAPASVRESFRVGALLANFAAFGLATTILAHYPEWNTELGRGGRDYGNLVGGIFLAQTVGFVVLLWWPGWHYRVLPLVLAQAGAAAAAMLLATAYPVLVLLPFMLLTGGGLAMAYYASIYYSLHSDVARGGRAGLHEAIIGSGHVVVPLLAGVAARVANTARMPYLVAGTVVLVSLFVQLAFFARSRPPAS